MTAEGSGFSCSDQRYRPGVRPVQCPEGGDWVGGERRRGCGGQGEDLGAGDRGGIGRGPGWSPLRGSAQLRAAYGVQFGTVHAVGNFCSQAEVV